MCCIVSKPTGPLGAKPVRRLCAPGLPALLVEHRRSQVFLPRLAGPRLARQGSISQLSLAKPWPSRLPAVSLHASLSLHQMAFAARFQDLHPC